MNAFALLASLTLTTIPAQAAEPYLTLGKILERSEKVRGHGKTLREAMAWALRRSGAYKIIADEETVRLANEQIAKVNRASTADEQWIEIGRSTGATHLLVGELRGVGKSCLATVRIVHLEKKETAQSQPRGYDCTEQSLVLLSRALTADLTGVKIADTVSAPLPLPPPVSIVVDGDTARVDGDEVPLPKRPRARAEPREYVPSEPPARPEPSRREKPRPSAPPVPAVTPVEPPPGYTLPAFGRDLVARSDLIALVLFGMPLVTLLVAWVIKSSKGTASRWIARKQLTLSFLLAFLHAGGLLVASGIFDVKVFSALPLVFVLSPGLAFLGAIVGARLALRE